jgi:serine phosphatase RsbU (regulator of sigma subunit)
VPKDSSLTLNVFRPSANEIQTYRALKSALPDSFLRVIPPTALVYDVFKNGASERAGMRVGDLIVCVNGKFLQSYQFASREADTILRSGQAGKTITYDVLRDNRLVKLKVRLAKFGISFPLLIISLCGLVYMGTGAFIGWQRPQIKAARLLGMAFVVMGFFTTVVMLMRTIEQNLPGLLKILVVSASFFFGIALYFHSSYYFPTARTELISKRWLFFTLYGIAALGWFSTILLASRLGNAAFVWGIMISLALMIALTLTTRFIHRRKQSAEYKKLSRLIKWTGAVVGAVVVLLLVTVLDNNTRGYIGLPLLFIPLAYLHTIGSYRLLDLDLRVRRNVQYMIVSIMWMLLLLTLAFMVFLKLSNVDLPLPNIRITGSTVEILDAPLSPEQRSLYEKGALIVIAMALTFAFWQLGRTGLRFIAGKFHRGQFDYRRAAGELADVMATKLSMIDLARGIVQKLTEILQLKGAGVVFFRDEKVRCCQEAYGFDGKTWDELCLTIDQSFINILQQFRSESRFSVDYLPYSIKERVQNHGFRHIIPIRFKEKLVGTLLVGEKRSESPFYSDDLLFLSAVAKQASVAIENAFLHEELSEQERLKHELAIARRIQLASLPQITPRVNGLDIAGISIPALEVGGDYFDYLNGVPNEITVIVGDVSGKGTSAALYMSKVQGILRSLHGFGLSPKELFIRANKLLCQDLERKSFVTSLGADFDATARRLIFARAGHLPLFYYQARTRRVEKITPKGLGLGLDNHGAFATELEERSLQYEFGDVFLFVTDGVTEAQTRSGKEFGEESLSGILENSSTLSATQIRDQIINAVKQFCGDSNQHDDLTVVVVKAV